MTQSVLTLIAGRAFAGSWDAILRIAAEAIDRLGGHRGDADWLAPGHAVDLAFSGLDVLRVEAAVRARLRDEIGDLALDMVAQHSSGRRKRLLLADMEATIIANEMLDELADLLGFGAEVAELTRRAMSGKIDFAAALRERVALLRGTPAGVLDEVARRIRVNPGARELVATMRAYGAFTALVSGGFRCFTSQVKAELGFDLEIANELMIEGAELTGRVREPILGREAKLAALMTLSGERGIALAQTMAVGDGANDVAMLEAAGLGIAFKAKPVVLERARHRIEHGDLSALLYVQGYRQAEIRHSVA